MQNQVAKTIKSYEVEGLIGVGGFGAVYKARQASVEREVAIKVIWPAFANHPNFIRRFEAEAQLVAGLEHPHIVPLYDYWRDPEGAYIVMRLLRGGHLRDRITGEGWALRDVGRLLGQMAAALDLAHRYNVIHRDIKPENILLDEDGNAYLADFGIAQILSTTSESEDEFGGMGSPGYAAPEQFNGTNTSAATDIFSLGMVVYELLAGRHPFPALDELTETEVLQLRTQRPVPPLHTLRADLPAAVNDVVQRALMLNPSERFSDVMSFAHAFQEVARLNGAARITTLSSTVVLPNPYKGLRAFQETDAALFFGREALVQRLIKRLTEADEYQRFLAIVGPSGSGKSSVAKAGLVPSLRQGALPSSDSWFYDTVIPGTNLFNEIANTLRGIASSEPPADLLQRLEASPLALHEALMAILPPDNSELFLLIDQFEEVFTQTGDEARINQILESLYQAVVAKNSRLRLVITIRADFYDRPLLVPRLSDMVRERTEVVIPLSPTELERAIVIPARRVGVEIDPGLVEAIISEVKEQPGTLPLLQYTLSELFERREGLLVTAAAYKALGGVRGSLARRADMIYQELEDEAQRDALRQLMLRLITLGEGTEDTRRRVMLNEVTTLQESAAGEAKTPMRAVIDLMGQARLLTFDRDPVTRSPTVEITHEAIIREWATLRDWLDDSRNDVRQQRALAGLAHEWEGGRRDASFLLRGVRLEQYEKWAQASSVALTALERDYLDMSLRARNEAQTVERARAERERQLELQSLTRLRLLSVVLALAFVGALALVVFALTESARADRNSRISSSIALEASARNALATGDGDLAVALAMQANQMDAPPIQSLSTLVNVSLARGTRQLIDAHEAWVTDVVFSPDGRTLASSSTDRTVKLWDWQTQTLLYTLMGHGGDLEAITFSPDGRILASAASDFVIILWNAQTGQEIRRLTGHTQPVRTVAFTPDGSQLLSGGSDNRILLWDVATGEILREFVGHNASVLEIAISPDGQSLVSGARDGQVLQWNIADASLLRRLEGNPSAPLHVAYSHDGQRALATFADERVIVWDTQTGALVLEISEIGTEVRVASFSRDDRTILAAGIDGHLRLYSALTGRLLDLLRGHLEPVLALDVSPNGRFAATGSQDHQLRVWNISNPGEQNSVQTHANRTTQVLNTTSDRLYSVGADGYLIEHRTPTLEISRNYDLGTPLSSLALIADGERILVAGRDQRIYLVQMSDGAVLSTLEGHADQVQRLLISADGTQLLSGDRSGLIIRWDVATGQAVQRYTGQSGAINDLLWLPNEAEFLSASSDGTVNQWRTTTGEVVRRYAAENSAIYAISLSPDATRLAVGGRDGFVRLFDMETGQETTRYVTAAGPAWSLAYDEQGTKLAVGYEDGSIYLWDSVTGNIIETVSLPDASALTLAFADDGATLYSGHKDGSVVAWRSFSDDPAILAWTSDNRYIREFTCLEREQYRIEPLCP